MMTPERVHYHALLLIAGDHDLLDQEVQAAQEGDAPLDDLTLALLQCRDEKEILHVLREHLAAHPSNIEQVSAMILTELKSQLDSGAVTPAECLEKLHAITAPYARGGELFELSCETGYVDELREMAKEGIVSEAAFLTGLSAFLSKNMPAHADVQPAPVQPVHPASRPGKPARFLAWLRSLFNRRA